MNRAAKHWIIAAKLGYDDSLKGVKMLYEEGYVSKEDFAAALCGHQAAIDATTSAQRKEAARYFEFETRKGGGLNNYSQQRYNSAVWSLIRHDRANPVIRWRCSTAGAWKTINHCVVDTMAFA